MRILARVPGSVLWLQAGAGEANLRRHAEAAGIAPQRLVFAPHIDTEAYVARLRLADLYLDTLNWNTHTQGVDALWSGVPIITCPGEHWVSRLASGLLRAVGLADCIVDNLDAYEALACELATQPDKLAELKARLARNRDTHPLFDIERLVRNLDAAYLEMWHRHQSGAAPRGFDVQETPQT
jgi:predicted O-linked N-acetylglucosamine transferase (SPINDLY family)